MTEWSFSVGESGGKRLKTAGKYCDRDIRVDLDAAIPEEVVAQSALLDQAIAALEGKAAGGGGSDSGWKYQKFTAAPASTSTFTIDNPMGGFARIVAVKKVEPITGSSRKVAEYLVDANLGIGVMSTMSASDTVNYSVQKVDASPGNSQFTVTDGTITLRQYSSAVNFVSGALYEVEIWQ